MNMKKNVLIDTKMFDNFHGSARGPFLKKKSLKIVLFP